MKKPVIKSVLVITLLVALLPLPAVGTGSLSPTEAEEDAEFLRNKIEVVHPNPYFAFNRKNAESDFRKIIQKLKSRETVRILELYRNLAPFVASFQDGHTSLSIHGEFRSEHEGDGRIFPILVDISENEIRVLKSLAGSVPEPGSEIISINGVESSKIVEEISELIGAARKSFIEAKISRNFPIYLWALYEFSGMYGLTYRTATGKEKTTGIVGVPVSSYIEKRGRITRKREEYWNLSFPEDEVALLTINTFAGNLEKEFKNFVKNSFKIIENRKSKNLIIDLRDNGGGSTKLSDYLYSYVSGKPYRTFAEVRIKYSEPVLRERTIINPITLFKVKVLGDRTIVHKNGFRKPPARSNRFDGNLFVLTGPMTFSTAADFAALIKDLEAGKVVGEETGGLASSYGDVFSCRLPNSGLRLGISYKYFLRPGGFDDGRGVIPDIPIESNPVKRIKGKDVVLENLLKTIEKNHEVTQ